MKILARVQDAGLLEEVTAAANDLGAELIVIGGGPNGNDQQLFDALRTHPGLLFVEAVVGGNLPRMRAETRARGIGLVAACGSQREIQRVLEVGVDEWILLPSSVSELASRFQAAMRRRREGDHPDATSRAAEHLRYEELLYDRFTGFPTLSVMIDRGRDMLERAGRLTILYIEFVRYSKLEEIYGWQKLDEVLQTTANAVRVFYDSQREKEESLVMVSHTGDDDFIFFTDLQAIPAEVERRVNQIVEDLEAHIRTQLDETHGEDIAGLFSIYVGATTIFRNPKIRTERLIYRGIREAAQAARSVEHRERSRKVTDLKTMLREGAVEIEFHPIVVTDTQEVYGYEALARGGIKGMRSPEVMFGVAEEANLIWELSRLCRQRAIEGIPTHLNSEQYLFLNIDPHDFRDPTFRYLDMEELGIDHPERIVLEITERTAITDYPAFQEYLKVFREQGFRFAVDDAGSGYAGLGSIANLSPDFIKLDISLISGIDTNFMKQNLVETMVNFANDNGIKVIAEGVEREDEYETVKSLGCHFTQGFLFHQPRFMTQPTQPAGH
ncbi:MAG: EAL domain-containing response regulator [Gemmatimonadetes bacterium]|nr:EAL domain-containing response regulator [Gemmatimonadota bacterium]